MLNHPPLPPLPAPGRPLRFNFVVSFRSRGVGNESAKAAGRPAGMVAAKKTVSDDRGAAEGGRRKPEGVYGGRLRYESSSWVCGEAMLGCLGTFLLGERKHYKKNRVSYIYGVEFFYAEKKPIDAIARVIFYFFYFFCLLFLSFVFVTIISLCGNDLAELYPVIARTLLKFYFVFCTYQNV